jgi:hypothetical protein
MKPDGRPIYLATDGKAERIMHKEKGAEEVMVPLRTGSHTVRMQALAETTALGLGGRFEVPLATYPLTASRVGVTLGVPAFVYPLAFLGGDRPYWFLDEGDFIALGISLVLACIVQRGWSRRVLGAAALYGLWFIAEPLFVGAVGLVIFGAFFWLLGRLLSGKKLLLAVAALVMGGGFVLLIAMVGVAMRPAASPQRQQAAMPASPPPVEPVQSVAEALDKARDDAPVGGAEASKSVPGGARAKSEAYGRRGNFMAQDAAGGVLEGVTPVALTLPQYERSIYATRELVTRERPFRPVLVYATAWAAWPLVIGWLLCIGALVRLYRSALSALAARIRARLARGSSAPAVPPPPAPTAT